MMRCKSVASYPPLAMLYYCHPLVQGFDMFDNFEHRGQQFIEAVEALAA